MSFGGSVKLTGESEYRRALSQITQNLREVSSQMKVVSSSFDANDKSTEALTAKEEVLNKQLDEQNKKLDILKKQYASMSSQYTEQTQKHDALVTTYEDEKNKLEEIGRALGTSSKEYQEQKNKVAELEQEVIRSTKAQEDNEKSMSKMRQQINNAQADINNTTRAIENLGEETEDAGKSAEDAGEGFTVFKGIVANLASSAIQSAVRGLQKLASALVDVGKQAYESYAEYEQLVGGVETLFGKSASTVQEYADNAYKTAGLSANEYMETVTSFSASLLQGLNGDTAKSAEIADMAITDMSDNANKMGTSMESIQNAYQGFAKQNFTMLDNLKLGYGGTKTEMLRLVKEAGVVEESVKSMDDVSFDQIIKAINIVQKRMGITGTTAKEASSTIEGSTKSVKASWQNLMVSIANGNGNLGESLKTFTDNVQVMLSNAVPRIKQIASGLWKAILSMAKQYMPNFANNILPVLEKIFNVVKSVVTFIVKNFSTIAPIILGIASAFAVWNATMSIVNTIKAVTTALKGLEAGTALVTKAQAVYNAVLSANPIGAVIMAVTALIAVFVALAGVQTEAQKKHKEEMDALNEQAEAVQANTDAWNDLTEARQADIDAGMTEISHYQSLYDELKNITDANGKVKKGYEERASFIASQLSEALGIEITMTDGVIKKYTELQDEIDKTMEKKKAQIILDAQESMYKEAIQQQTNALKDLNTMQDNYEAKQNEVFALEQQLSEAKAGLRKASSVDESKYWQAQQYIVEEGMRMKQEELQQAEDNYNNQKNLLQQYAYEIGVYEQNMELAHSGQYDKMTTVNWDYVKDYKDSADSQKAMLEDQISNEETQLQLLKEMKKQYGTDMFDDQIKQAQKSLAQHKADLKSYTSATEQGNKETVIAWQKGLAEQLSELTGAEIKFKKTSDGLIQMYVNGVKEGEPKSKTEMAKLITNTINEISKQATGATKAGEDLIDGVNNGIANQQKQSGVFATIANFGASLLSHLKLSLQEQSPSKATEQMGKYLIDGLNIGFDKGESGLLNNVSSVGQRVIESLNSELGQGVKIGDISANTSQTSGYFGMVDAFKQALSEMKIELDDDEVGRFIDKTVTRAIYS